MAQAGSATPSVPSVTPPSAPSIPHRALQGPFPIPRAVPTLSRCSVPGRTSSACPGCQRDPIPRRIPVPLPAGFKGAGRELHPSPRFSWQRDARRATAGRGCDAGSWERWPGSQGSVRKQQAASQGASFPVPPPGPGHTVPRRDNGAQGCCSSPEPKGRQVAASPPRCAVPTLGQPLSSAPPRRPQLLPRR